jgi:hypothetical protein
MAKGKTQREIAERYHDRYTAENRRTTYYNRWHPFRRGRFLLSCGACALGALWVFGTWASGDETVFSSGPLAASHRTWERDCAACHTEPFARVKEETCLACHRAGPHVPAGKGADPACGTCHAEHRGRETLTQVGDEHCNACHEDHRGRRSFADHGPFVPLAHDQHLKFNHRSHLDPELPAKVRLEGFAQPLRCADCHAAAGAGFAPIAFEAHCARCHKEMLDPGAAGEAVPHGVQLAHLIRWIEGFYLRHGRDGAPLPEPRDAASAAADARASLAALIASEKASCGLCHELEAAGPGAPAIRKPDVPTSWRRRASFDATASAPLARFDHGAHRFAMEGAPAGPDGNCLHCHGSVRESKDAKDWNLPRIDTCKSCHRPGGAGDGCVECHGFHAPAR